MATPIPTRHGDRLNSIKRAIEYSRRDPVRGQEALIKALVDLVGIVEALDAHVARLERQVASPAPQGPSEERDLGISFSKE